MQKKRKKIFLISSISLIISFILIIGFLIKKKINIKNKNDMVYMYTEKGEVYTLENKKLGSNIIGTVYFKGLKKHIIIDNMFDAYLVNEKGEKNKFASNIKNSDKIICLKNNIYYIDSKGNLYEKSENNKDSIKIDSDINNIEYLDEDKMIYYNNDWDLYIKNTKQESIKVGSKTFNYKFNKKNNKVIYTSNQIMYLYDIEKDLKKKIIKSEIYIHCCGFTMNDGFIYKVGYEKDSHFKYDLFYKKLNKKEPIKLDSEVNEVEITPNGQGIFYGIEGKGIFYNDLNKEKPIKIYDKEEQIYNVGNDKVYIIEKINNKKNLSELDVKGNKKVLAEDIDLKFIKIFKDSVAYLKNNILYIGSTKMEENIKKFYIKEKDIVCLTKDNKMLIIKSEKDKKLLIPNIKKYKTICISNEFKYENKLAISDIEGWWAPKNNKNTMIKFTNNTEEIITLYSKQDYKITSEDNEYKSMTIRFNDGYTQKVKLVDENNIEIAKDGYKKVDNKIFETFKSKLDIMKKSADVYLRGNTELWTVYHDKNNKEYFLYVKHGSNPTYVLVDETGKLFNHNNFYELENPEPIKI